MPSPYFPPLDLCLSGESRLISWKTAYRALSNLDNALENASLEDFLTSEETLSILKHSLQPFGQPSEKSKNDFETKTAPIHVGQSQNGGYHLEQLKDDALWLSKELGVEELVGLRTALLEWQQRPADELLDSGLEPSQSGTLSIIRGSFGSSVLGQSLAPPQLPSQAYDSGDLRHSRQLEIFLQERTYIRKLGVALVERHVHSITFSSKAHESWLDSLSSKVAPAQEASSSQTREHLLLCISSIDDGVRSIDDFTQRPGQFRPIEGIPESIGRHTGYVDAATADMISQLRMLVAHVHMQKTMLSSSVILEWFRLVDRLSFSEEFAPLTAAQGAVIPLIQSLVATVSLAILALPQAIAHIQNAASPSHSNSVSYPRLPGGSEPYIEDTACVREITVVLYKAACSNFVTAAPAMYAWSLITGFVRDVAQIQHESKDRMLEDVGTSSDHDLLHGRRSSSLRGSSEPRSIFERLFESVQDYNIEKEHRDDPPTFLMQRSVDDLNVYRVVGEISTLTSNAYATELEAMTPFLCRLEMLSLVKEGMLSVTYGEEVLDAVLAILGPPALTTPQIHLNQSLAARFLQDEDLRSQLLDQALARFPFELSPALRLLTVLAESFQQDPNAFIHLMDTFENLTSMTLALEAGFKTYELSHEEEGLNEIRLTDDVLSFMTKAALRTSRLMNSNQLLLGQSNSSNHSKARLIPPGTLGVMMTEEPPWVVRFHHSYSGLHFLGLYLSTFAKTSELIVAPPGIPCDNVTATETLMLVTSFLQACKGTPELHAHLVTGLNSALPSETDFTALVAGILDGELLAHLDQSASQGSLELIVACLNYFNALLPVHPERVWSVLAQSSLVGLNSGSGALVAVVSGSEVPLGRFSFLHACTKLYGDLVDDAISGLVRRKAVEKQKANRFDSPVQSPDYTPERTISSVLAGYTKVLADALQNMSQWQFAISEEKVQVYVSIFVPFRKIIEAVYGLHGTFSGLGRPLVSAADLVLTCCAPNNGDFPLLPSLADLFRESLVCGDDMLPLHRVSLLADQVIQACGLLQDAIRHFYDGHHRVQLATHVLDLVPLLAPVMAAEPRNKLPVVDVLRQALSAFGDEVPDSASVIRRLTSSSAKSFLAVLVQLDAPLKDISLECATWALLSTIMDSRLPWLAIFVLTGSIPKDRLKQSDSNSPGKGRPLLAYALDQLSRLKDIAPDRAIAMMGFVAHAQKAWVWATSQLLTHPEFIKNALDWLEQIRPASASADPAQSMLSAREMRMAALLCDIFAINLHASLESGDTQLLKLLAPRLKFLSEHAASVNGYKYSLHKNLANNFKARFPGCQVDMFKRTQPEAKSYGRDFAYNVNLAEQVLGHDQSWYGSSKSKSSGFAEEFARSSTNLSLIDAQERLLSSWKTLAVTLSECLQQEAELQASLAKATERCLQANFRATVEDSVVAERQRIRLDLAFVLISKLVSSKATCFELKTLIAAAWDVIRSSPVTYDVAIALDDLAYLRTSLQILYMSIQPHIYLDVKSPGPKSDDGAAIVLVEPAITATIVEIVSKVVCPSFMALCSNLHDRIELAEPGDFALVSAILQASLSVRGVGFVYPQLTDAVAKSSIIYAATSLFSWSDQLAEVMHDDPIYGEIAIMFLVALSTVPAIATDMALAGVLSQLSAANLSNYFRKPGGRGPFDEPQRVFVIWYEGFLPLCLNLLAAVGPPISTEVATFLNSFPQQLERAGTALQNRAPTSREPNAGSVTLGLLSEAHNLAMLSRILASDVARAAAEGIDSADVPPLSWNMATVKEDINALTRNKRSLADRITAVGDREAAWKIKSASGTADNMLVAKLMKEVNEIKESGAFSD
ncbi:hypothetical protein K431DRAFT_280497 [Polychaeton citri CBS 116435]|uniref:Nucleoporin NUP188 n=1 Tax=Polychaeton citri CBS 116435 TaxID=1314669 RepID=A0A9P4QJ08_9PEZI|nr:hypothetical protein K431DRAFT_280497 [Polychaeton citri CBS 116435]